MYEIKYGKKYDEKLSRKEIAAKFREDVKAEQKAGVLPKSLKLSVRCPRGSSIDADIVAIDCVIFSREWLERNPREFTPAFKRYTPEFASLVQKLNAMLQAYNYDGSEIETDYFNVRFYGHVGVNWKFESAREAQEKEAVTVVSMPVAPAAKAFPPPGRDTNEAAEERLRIGMLKQEERDQAAAKMEANEDPLARAF